MTKPKGCNPNTDRNSALKAPCGMGRVTLQAMLREARHVLLPTTGQPVLLRVGVHSG